MNSKMQSEPPSRGSTACSARSPSGVDDDELPGLELPFLLRAEEVERAALGREQLVVPEPAEHQRPDPVRVAEADQLSLREEHRRERALDAGHRSRDRLLQRALVAGDEGGDHLGVRGGREPGAAREQLGADLAPCS